MFTLVTKATKLVVSDNGDILSPKTAPAIIAPCHTHIDIQLMRNDINAIPAVEADPQAVPVAKLLIADIKRQKLKSNVDLKTLDRSILKRNSSRIHPTPNYYTYS